MNKSPVHLRYERNQYNPHDDFAKLLKKAERNIDRSKTNSVVIMAEEDSRDETKKKTLWKAFVLRLWKGEKKKTKDETTSHHRALRRRFMSGSVRSFSGPVMSGLFSPIRKSGKGNNAAEIPYVCLDQLGMPFADNNDKNYGPLYLVT